MAAEESYPKLISLAVHELRTPVGVVAGYLRMLGMDADSPLSERQRRMVDEANKSCGRLVALLADLSEVSKLDDGIVGMARQPLDLFPLVAEATADVREGSDRGVRLEVQGLPVGARLRGDRDRLQAAFGAIFSAILREKPGPSVVIADRRIVQDGGGRSAVVIVSDGGHAQEAYDATPAPFNEKRGGVGLSLAIARRVIEAHGARLWSPALADPREGQGIALVAFRLDD